MHVVSNATSRGRVVGIGSGYGLNDVGVGVRVPGTLRILTSPYRLDRPWCSRIFLSNGYRELFSRGGGGG
jgi:hypothetical protein